MSTRDILAAQAVYDGRTYLGEVVERRCGQWAAVNADGHEIGVFGNAQAAYQAVIAAGAGRAGSRD